MKPLPATIFPGILKLHNAIQFATVPQLPSAVLDGGWWFGNSEIEGAKTASGWWNQLLNPAVRTYLTGWISASQIVCWRVVRISEQASSIVSALEHVILGLWWGFAAWKKLQNQSFYADQKYLMTAKCNQHGQYWEGRTVSGLIGEDEACKELSPARSKCQPPTKRVQLQQTLYTIVLCCSEVPDHDSQMQPWTILRRTDSGLISYQVGISCLVVVHCHTLSWWQQKCPQPKKITCDTQLLRKNFDGNLLLLLYNIFQTELVGANAVCSACKLHKCPQQTEEEFGQCPQQLSIALSDFAYLW